MTVRTIRSVNEQTIRADGAPFGGALDPKFDGCRDAVAIRSSMPQRGRLDINDRSVVVTARLGAAMILQRIPLNAYKGVAAQLDASGETTVVNVVLRHHDPAYTITLDKDLPLEEAVAIWRAWADRLSVPLLLSEPHGEDSVVRAMLGAVVVRASQPRKAKPLARRRPRYAKRRGMR
jgi:hypothetical protein